jgi:hypothetical protein
MQYFTSNWHKNIRGTLSQINICWGLSVCEVKIHKKGSKCPPPKSVHVQARLNVDFAHYHLFRGSYE